jgi:hypothetical protein
LMPKQVLATDTQSGITLRGPECAC